MRQFDVFKTIRNSNIPYLLVVQHDLLEDLPSRIVVPLWNPKVYRLKTMLERLTPVIQVEGMDYILVPHEIAAIDAKNLKEFVVNISDQRDVILSAMDLLTGGV
jgi:toxin CcdB